MGENRSRSALTSGVVNPPLAEAMAGDEGYPIGPDGLVDGKALGKAVEVLSKAS